MNENTKKIVMVAVAILAAKVLFGKSGGSGAGGNNNWDFSKLPDGTPNTFASVVNNNPLNLKGTATAAYYTGQTGVNGVWRVFSSKVYGLRAAIHLLRRFINEWEQNTIETIIKGNANHGPWSTTDQNAYISFIENYTGINKNQLLTFDKETIKRLSLTMSRFETGFKFVNESDFEQAWELL